jgi:hypothetical protein
VGLACAATACGADDRPLRPSESDDLGSLGLALDAAPGVSLGSFSYTITGPGGFSRQASVDLSGSSKLSTLVGGLPVGTGFGITLQAKTLDGSTQCGGSASFDVAARATTQVTVHLQCHEAARTGSVLINGTLNLCPVIDSLGASPAEALVGSRVTLTALAHDTDGLPTALAYAWRASSGTLSSPSSASPSFQCTASGDVTLTLSVSDGDCSDTLSATVGCTSPAGGGEMAGLVVINELESNGGVPGDWVELYNAGAAPVDLSGWKFKDNDDSHAFYVIPAGTTLLPGAYYVLEEAAFGFGLGAADSARLWDQQGVAVDSYAWTAHATTTYARCANGVGPLTTSASSTKGVSNDCGSSAGGSGGAGGGAGSGGSAGSGGGASGSGGSGGSSGGAGGSGGVASFAWPGTDAVVTVDTADTFGTNLSGLEYQPASPGAPAVLWAVQNGPSKLFRLLWNGSTWAPDSGGAWGTGKLLHYSNGAGAPDSEGVSKAEWIDSAIYVATERDNNDNGVSRLSLLRFDTNASGAELSATNDWNLTADLPVVGPNLGLEAVTYIPDAALVAGGFFDEARHAPYVPGNYPNHGSGLFFVGVEGNGNIYGYALDHVTNAFTRVASWSSGQVSIMDLSYDREVGYLWGYCDNTCANKATVFRLDTSPGSATAGRFLASRVFDHPSSLGSSNNEGIAFAPEAECSGGQKSFFWSDDDQLAGHALRRGTIPCGAFF